MKPFQIKESRLSEDSSSESSTSMSGDSETDRQTDNTDEDLNQAAATATPPVKTSGWLNEEEFEAYVKTVPELAGKYTDADPAFAADRDDAEPPCVMGYTGPRRFNNAGGGGGGGYNKGGHCPGYRGYNNRGYCGGERDRYGGNHYQKHNNWGGGGHWDRERDNQGRNNYRGEGERSRGYGGGGSSSGSSGGGNYQDNRYNNQDRREESGYRKRKYDHSHSTDQNSQFFARPIGNNKRPGDEDRGD